MSPRRQAVLFWRERFCPIPSPVQDQNLIRNSLLNEEVPIQVHQCESVTYALFIILIL